MNLNSIRKKETLSFIKQLLQIFFILILGIALGVFSKYLDTVPSNNTLFLLEYFDIRNFLGRFAIWVTLGVLLSIHSHSPFNAAIKVFIFFLAMVTSYYLYSKYVAGFFPKSYALIWFGFTALSPFLAFICWYSKGIGKASFLLSSMILGVLLNMCFVYGNLYFDIRSIPELLVFIVAVFSLRRNSVKETALLLATAFLFALFFNFILPFHFG